MKKKLLIALLVLVMVTALSVAVLAGCTDDDSDGNGAKVINIVVPDGSPAIALAKLINDNSAPEGYTVNYSVVAGATQISTAIANKTADIAIAPTNIGATIYNKTGAVKLYATVVQGALYMVGKESLAGDTVQEKLASLKGQTVFNIGQGGTPDLTFKYILDNYGIAYQATDVEDESYVALRYVTDGSELLPMLKQGTAKYGILGEPAVSRANANTGTSTVFDIQELFCNTFSFLLLLVLEIAPFLVRAYPFSRESTKPPSYTLFPFLSYSIIVFPLNSFTILFISPFSHSSPLVTFPLR